MPPVLIFSSWNVVGLAIRIAHGLGLHIRNTDPHLSPEIKELRVRIWYSMVYLEVTVRCAHYCYKSATDPHSSVWLRDGHQLFRSRTTADLSLNVQILWEATLLEKKVQTYTILRS